MCAILVGFRYDMATALMNYRVTGSVEWLLAALEPVAQTLSFSMGPGTVSLLIIEIATCLVQNQKEPTVAQPLLQAVFSLRTPPS